MGAPATQKSRKEEIVMAVTTYSTHEEKFSERKVQQSEASEENEKWFYTNLFLKFVPLSLFMMYIGFAPKFESSIALTLSLGLAVLLGVISVAVWLPAFNIKVSKR